MTLQGSPDHGSTDETLVAATRAGDDVAFGALYERYVGEVTGFLHRMLRDYGRAEELAQETFISALRQMRRTDSPIAFRSWVYRIARNAAIDHIRHRSCIAEVSIADGPERLADPRCPEEQFDRRHSLESLTAAFSELSDAHHELLVMRELEGLTYEEIGSRLGMSKAAAQSGVFRARQQLAGQYGEIRSGDRCRWASVAMESLTDAVIRERERRKLRRHLGRCLPCRRRAVALGVGELVHERQSLRQRVAALLPLPFLRQRLGGRAAPPAAGSLGGQSGAIGQAAGPLAEAASHLAAAGAVVAAGAILGVGSLTVADRLDDPIRGIGDRPAREGPVRDGGSSGLGEGKRDALRSVRQSPRLGSGVAPAGRGGHARARLQPGLRDARPRLRVGHRSPVSDRLGSSSGRGLGRGDGIEAGSGYARPQMVSPQMGGQSGGQYTPDGSASEPLQEQVPDLAPRHNWSAGDDKNGQKDPPAGAPGAQPEPSASKGSPPG